MQIKIFVLGPLDNNTIVVFCQKTKKAAIIDPSFGSFDVVSTANFFEAQYNIKANIKPSKAITIIDIIIWFILLVLLIPLLTEFLLYLVF